MKTETRVDRGLRKKFVNSSLANKTCAKCNKEYPRNENYFYKQTHPSNKGAFRYSSECITCQNKRSLEWKSGNKNRKREVDIKYRSGKIGFFRDLWHGMKRSRHGNEFKTFEEFLDCWEEQKKILGMMCPILGIEMTMIKGINMDGVRRKATDTNISKNRVLSSRPYSKQNLIFVSWKANNMQGDITPLLAKRYLAIVKERYGTDEVE